MALTIDKNHFQKNGEHFFYLADTCWSAFTNITEQDWEYYLQYRKRQGYNVLQINILPQWDASATHLNHVPFGLNDEGSYDFSIINQDYFDHAKQMCEVAKQYGFELALVVLWCNYVPGTWANNFISKNTMPYDQVTSYVEKVHETFSDLDPMYVVSGDTDLEEEISRSYYIKASDKLRELAPGCLQTLHVRGRLMEIQPELIERVDFYMFQSGHNAKAENLGMPYELPEYFRANYPIKPMINSEPCYEQMGYSSKMYGRFHDYDIRRAAWMSILSWADAGITYGAAGIYSWHTHGTRFETSLAEGFDIPNPWQLAIHYQGAWDYGDIRNILRNYRVKSLVPHQDKLVNDTKEIRLATDEQEKLMLIYVPANTTVKIAYDLHQDEDQVTIIDLQTRHQEVGTFKSDGKTTNINMHGFNHDVLYVIERK